MRRFLTLALASTTIFAMTAGDAAAAGKNSPSSCGMGAIVSGASLELNGLGKYFHELGYKNVGNGVIQPYHEFVKEDCSFDFGGV
jgi:hypothetical protein